MDTTEESLENLLHRVRYYFECTICLNELVNPYQGPCGHTYCKDCALRSAVISNHCPLCKEKFSRRSLRSRDDIQALINCVQKYMGPRSPQKNNLILSQSDQDEDHVEVADEQKPIVATTDPVKNGTIYQQCTENEDLVKIKAHVDVDPYEFIPSQRENKDRSIKKVAKKGQHLKKTGKSKINTLRPKSQSRTNLTPEKTEKETIDSTLQGTSRTHRKTGASPIGLVKVPRKSGRLNTIQQNTISETATSQGNIITNKEEPISATMENSPNISSKIYASTSNDSEIQSSNMKPLEDLSVVKNTCEGDIADIDMGAVEQQSKECLVEDLDMLKQSYHSSSSAPTSPGINPENQDKIEDTSIINNGISAMPLDLRLTLDFDVRQEAISMQLKKRAVQYEYPMDLSSSLPQSLDSHSFSSGASISGSPALNILNDFKPNKECDLCENCLRSNKASKAQKSFCDKELQVNISIPSTSRETVSNYCQTCSVESTSVTTSTDFNDLEGMERGKGNENKNPQPKDLESLDAKCEKTESGGNDDEEFKADNSAYVKMPCPKRPMEDDAADAPQQPSAGKRLRANGDDEHEDHKEMDENQEENDDEPETTDIAKDNEACQLKDAQGNFLVPACIEGEDSDLRAISSSQKQLLLVCSPNANDNGQVEYSLVAVDNSDTDSEDAFLLGTPVDEDDPKNKDKDQTNEGDMNIKDNSNDSKQNQTNDAFPSDKVDSDDLFKEINTSQMELEENLDAAEEDHVDNNDAISDSDSSSSTIDEPLQNGKALTPERTDPEAIKHESQEGTLSQKVAPPDQESVLEEKKNAVESVSKTNNEKKRCPKRLVLCPSRLKKRQFERLIFFARLTSGKVVREFTDEVTHLVMDLEEQQVPQTIKYLFAIAGKKWIVVFKWIEDCLKARDLLPEEPYEISNLCESETAARDSRTTDKSLLPFTNFVLIGRMRTLGFSAFQRRGLLLTLGGTIASDPYSIHHNVIVLSDFNLKTDEVKELYDELGHITLTWEWLLDSIMNFRLMPFRSEYVVTQLSPGCDVSQSSLPRCVATRLQKFLDESSEDS